MSAIPPPGFCPTTETAGSDPVLPVPGRDGMRSALPVPGRGGMRSALPIPGRDGMRSCPSGSRPWRKVALSSSYTQLQEKVSSIYKSSPVKPCADCMKPDLSPGKEISMDFRTLTYFVTVARELNITHAAASLNMSQPPLSKQISLLEQDYGTQLFIRSKQGLTLTDTGKILYKRAMQMLELAERTREEVTKYEKELSGSLVLGCVEGRAPFLLARWICGFRDEFPLVTYTLRNAGTDEIMDQLLHHLIDLAIVAAPYNQEHLTGFPVSTQPWVAMIPKDHPLAVEDGCTVRLPQLAGEPLIIPERQSRVLAIEQWFESQNLTPQFFCRTSSYVNAVSLVEQGMGICIFPQATYTPNPHIVTKLITEPAKKAEYVLVYAKDQPLTETAEAFRDYVSDFLIEDRIHSARFKTREDEFDIPADAQIL